jgi:hypothetical protein
MPLRQFTDARGVSWQVWDTLPEKIVSNTLEGGWLTFQSEGEKRRLAPIPLYWANAPEDELRALLARARPVAGIAAVPPGVDLPRPEGR